MTYDCFINFLRTVQTEHVKTLSFPGSCSTEQVPNAFYTVLGEIVSFMQANISELCNEDQIIGLFGLQAASGVIKSELPLLLNRIHYTKTPNYHFCCVLNYLVLSKNQIDLPSSWQNHRSIVVDFTTGEIMDGDHFVSSVFQSDSKGRVFGKLNQRTLKKSWKLAAKEIISKEKNKARNQDFLFGMEATA